MAENIIPDGDVSLGGWTTQAGGVSNLYQAIDEAPTLNSSDYVQSATNPVVDTYEFTFSNPSALLASGVVNVVAGKKLNNSAVVNLKFQLLQSSTLIAEWTVSDIPYTPTLNQFTLTAPQIAAITDPNNLRGKLIANPSTAFAFNDLGSAYYDSFSAQAGTSGFMTLSGANVTGWKGQKTGSTRVLSSSVLTQPTFSTNKIVIANAGTVGFDVWSAALGASTWDVLMVLRLNADNAFRALLNDPGGNGSYFLVGNDDQVYSYLAGTKGPAVSIPWVVGTAPLRLAYFSITANNAAKMALDGNTPATIVLGGSTYPLSAIPYIGTTAAGQGFGEIHEMAFFQAGLSDTDRQKGEGRLCHDWDARLGVSTLKNALPSGHPYKSVAP